MEELEGYISPEDIKDTTCLNVKNTSKKIIATVDRFKKEFPLAILAGMFIGIAAMQYLILGGITGAILFAVGLIAVCSYHFKLFTGTAGFVENKEDLLALIWVLIGNLIGTFILSRIARCSALSLADAANIIVNNKLSIPLHNIFCLSIGCGMLMTYAVEFARADRWLPLLFAVPTFIICGFPHCIADSFYIFTANNIINWGEVIAMYICIVLGNFVGCNAVSIINYIFTKCRR